VSIQARAENQSMLFSYAVSETYSQDAEAVVAPGDCLATLKSLPDGLAKLIVVMFQI
jgi:hypothetical protein